MTRAIAADSRTEVMQEIREAERFILVTHENPDGDALGSLVATHEILARLGKDSLMFMSPEEFPLPYEYRFFLLDGLISVPPDDVAARTAIFLDCGNIDRNPADLLKRDGIHILNIDHHHDNTRFGTINHVVPEASCTAEIVWDLMRGLGVEASPTIAEALYVGLVTDTGRFMYENTGTRAHLMAAELIAAARALANVERYDDGRLTITRLTASDYAQTGAEENYSEGVVDHLRSVEGTAVAALVRDLLGAERAGRRKVSLRATDERIDVSAIARTQGGGGHRQAAGFGTEMRWRELVDFLRAQIAAQLDAG